MQNSRVPQSPEDVASAVSDHPALKALARAGYAVNGVLHLLIAAIVARVVLGGGGEAEPSGALQAVAEAPLGGILLWVVFVGYAGLAIWQALDAVTGYRPGGDAASIADRLKDGGKAGVYAVLAWTTWRFASGGGTDSGESTADFTAALMSVPWGRGLVALVAVGVAVVGGFHIWKGLTRRFLRDLEGNADGHLGDSVTAAGLVGYAAKGAALIMVAALFGWAAWTADPQEATGLDGAIQTVSSSPFGATILVIVSVGFVAYGAYCFARARYARV